MFEDKQEGPDQSDASNLSEAQGPGAFKKRSFSISNVFNSSLKSAIVKAILADEAGSPLTKEEATIRVLISSKSRDPQQGISELSSVPGISSVSHLVDGIYSADFDVRSHEEVSKAACIQYVEGKSLKRPH